MPIALSTAVPPSQRRQGVGARLVRRLGGAVRSAIGSAINLARAVRRPAVPQTSRYHAAAQTPAPSRVPHPRSPYVPPASPALLAWAANQTKAPAKRAGEAAAPLLPPLLTRLLLSRRRQRLAAISRPPYRNRHDTPFTPRAFPQLSPKASAVLNTPLKDCDPRTLELVLSTFAQHIGELMSPEGRITDPQAILPNLWHRISTALGDTNVDTSLSTTPQAVSATLADPVPADAPVASPHPPAPPTSPWTNLAPRPSPLPLSGPHPCVSVCICGSILLLPLCRLYRPALTDRAPNPAHLCTQ